MNIIISLIILIILLLFITKSDHFGAHNCVFEPWGPNLQACIETCKSNSVESKKPWNISNSSNSINCDYDTCAEKCNKCTNIERCEWLNPFEIATVSKQMSNEGTNNELELRLDPNENDYLIWDHNKDDEENEHVMLHYLKSNDDSSKVNIIYLNQADYLMYGIKKTGNESYEIRYPINKLGLDLDEKYTFFIYKINKNGVSNASNKIVWPN